MIPLVSEFTHEKHQEHEELICKANDAALFSRMKLFNVASVSALQTSGANMPPRAKRKIRSSASTASGAGEGPAAHQQLCRLLF
jgi:hypothetical protein